MAAGVPSPYVVHVHPYPTRYHGGIWTRPVFGLPYVERPYAVFKPQDFYPQATSGFFVDEQGGPGKGLVFGVLAAAGAFIAYTYLKARREDDYAEGYLDSWSGMEPQRARQRVDQLLSQLEPPEE